jgi:Flp pilus assembly protein TadG
MMRHVFRNFVTKGQNAVAGSAAIEFAIVAPALVLALIGTADLGLGIHRKMQVENAALRVCRSLRIHRELDFECRDERH